MGSYKTGFKNNAILCWVVFRKSMARVLFYAMAASVFILGIMLEFVQFYIPARTFSLHDIGDVLGALFFIRLS